MQKQAILDGKDLPSYEALAGYVFFTATGDEFQPAKMKRAHLHRHEPRPRRVPDLRDEMAKLKDLALHLELAREIAQRSNRQKLVFAPTKYLDQDYLDRLRIEFCQLPFEIYQQRLAAMMQLKEYQQETLKAVRAYLESLAAMRAEAAGLQGRSKWIGRRQRGRR